MLYEAGGESLPPAGWQTALSGFPIEAFGNDIVFVFLRYF
jgi:hypothetical protein